MSLDLESRSAVSNKIVCASTNVPTAFDFANPASLALQGIAYARGIAIVNETTSRIAFNYTHGSTTSSPTAVQAYVPAGGSGSFSATVLDEIKVSSTIYIKSDTGSPISSGNILLWIW